MKRTKKFLSLMLLILLTLGLNTNAYAMTNEPVNMVNEWEVEILSDDYFNKTTNLNNDNITPLGGDSMLYTDKFEANISTSEYWSGYARVSDNLVTGSSGGSITSTSSKTFEGSVTWSPSKPSGISISAGASKSSSIGYELDVPPHSRVYMGYRVRYKKTVDKITRTWVNGKVEIFYATTNKTLYGEYALINY